MCKLQLKTDTRVKHQVKGIHSPWLSPFTHLLFVWWPVGYSCDWELTQMPGCPVVCR